jgi:hypothetical protein
VSVDAIFEIQTTKRQPINDGRENINQVLLWPVLWPLILLSIPLTPRPDAVVCRSKHEHKAQYGHVPHLLSAPRIRAAE